VKQLYGMTESSVFIAIQKDGEARLDTVGTPIPGVEIRISEQGEVLFRSPGAFQGYYKNAAATAEMIDDGWVHTGDAGFIDHDGHLKIIDRAKDVGRLTDGTMFPPKYIENKLKFSPYIKEAMCVGRGQDYVAALINIDLTAVGVGGAKGRPVHDTRGPRRSVYDLMPRRCARQRSLQGDLLRARRSGFLILHRAGCRRPGGDPVGSSGAASSRRSTRR
jgi:long-chain acyl-CoA synthetase